MYNKILPLNREELKKLSKQNLIDRGRAINKAKQVHKTTLASHPCNKEQIEAIHALQTLDSMLHDVVAVLGYDPNRLEAKL